MKIQKKQNNNKTILEKKKQKKISKKTLYHALSINHSKKSHKTNIEKCKNIKETQDNNDIFDDNLTAFYQIKKNLSKAKYLSLIKDIQEISNIDNAKDVIKKITILQKQDIDDIILILKSLMDSFDEEYHSNSEYENVIFSILDEGIKNFSPQIIKNILETRCHEIISILQKQEGNNTNNKNNKVAISM